MANNKGSGLYIASGSWDKTIRIWSISEKRQESVMKGHTAVVISVVVTKDNKYVISGSWDNTIRIWNFRKYTRNVLQGNTSVFSLAVTSDNKYIISGSYDKTIKLWNFLEKRQETVLQGYTFWK